MRIVVIGAGFTGTLLSVALLRQARTPSEIVLIERLGAFGRGVAYSTPNPDHLLNVRASNMSAFPDDPSHFVRWLWRVDLPSSPAASVPPSGHAFVSRGIYGRYLADVLAEARAAAPEFVRFQTLAAEAVDVRTDRTGTRVVTDEGEAIACDRVALAVGNFPPSWPTLVETDRAGEERLHVDPWNATRISRIGAEESVMIIGTGLTMVDLVLSLEGQGHRAPIVAVSRRGFLPTEHREVPKPVASLDAADAGRPVSALLHEVRREVARHEAEGGDWRAVFDGLRPATQDLWRGMSLDQKVRFLRHLRGIWDVHRHRMAPRVAERVRALVAEGRLKILAARVNRAVADEKGVTVSLGHRSKSSRTERVGALINASGPEWNLDRIDDPLIQTLAARGAIRPDPLALGIDVTEDCALIDVEGRASPTLFAFGPVTRGLLWEIVAVPDIRLQCVEGAARLLSGAGTPEGGRAGERAGPGQPAFFNSASSSGISWKRSPTRP